MIPNLLKRFAPKSSFARAVGVLSIGTIVAQGLMVLILPLLTRLYSPQDFNVLAVYASVLGLFAAVACLRFNIAIPIPESDADAMNLLVLSLAAALGTSLLVALVLFALPAASVTQFGLDRHWAITALVPIGIFAAATYDALQYWASRREQFVLITKTRFTRAVVGGGTQLGLGLASPSPLGLLLGHLFYSGVGSVGLFRKLWSDDRLLLRNVGRESLGRVAGSYRRFPLYSVPEALLNTASAELPVLIIAARSSSPEAAYLMLAMRVLGLPMGLIGSSVAQVFLTEAPKRLRDGDLGPFVQRMMWTLLRNGSVPIGLAAALSPIVFPIVFGPEWARAGWLAAWIAPWYLLQFVTSPVSMVLHVLERTALAFLLQLAGFVIRVGGVLLALYSRPEFVAETFAVSGAVMYLLFVAVIMYATKAAR